MFSSHPFRNPYFSGYPTVGDPYSYGHPRQPNLYAAQRKQHAQRQRDRARTYIPHEYGYADSSDDDDQTRYDYGLGRNPYEYLYGRQTNDNEPRRKVRVTSPSPPPQKVPSPKPAKPVASLEVQEAAASKIQQAYRTHRSLAAINALELKFNNAKSLFTFPKIVDFQDPADREKVISVDSSTVAPISLSNSDPSSSHPSSLKPKLAYTSQNGPLHVYIESLNRLLTSLDAVQSWGQKSIRQRRKDVVRRIERELHDVEGVDPDPEEDIPEADLLKGWKGLWRRFMSQTESVHHSESDDLQQEEKMTVEKKESMTDEGVDVSFDEPVMNALKTTTAEELEVEEGLRPVDVCIPKEDDFVIV